MIKKLVSFQLLFFLGLSSLAILSASNFASAANIIQVPSPSYPTIQSALNALANDTTINIAPGTYNENLLFNNSMINYRFLYRVTIQGSTNTIINGNADFYGIIQLKIETLAINGKLKIGDNKAAPPTYIQKSIVNYVQVQSTTTIGGSYNTITNSLLHGLLISGGNWKMEDSGSNNTINNNQILNGITISSGSRSNKITGNSISSAQIGILEEAASYYYPTGNNLIYNNSIVGNQVGIRLNCASTDSYDSYLPDDIISNTFQNNQVGLEFYALGQFAHGSIICGNAFIGNTLQAIAHNSVTNTWDSASSAPRYGNYWSDYTGTDANHDGIGDTPYIIDSNNQDNYPIMSLTPLPTPTPSPTSSPTPSTNPTLTPSPTSTLEPTAAPTITPTQSPTQPTQNPTTTPDQGSTSGVSSNQNIPEIQPMFAIIIIISVTALLLAGLPATRRKTPF